MRRATGCVEIPALSRHPSSLIFFCVVELMGPRLQRTVGLDEITQAEHWEMFASLLPVGGTFQPGGARNHYCPMHLRLDGPTFRKDLSVHHYSIGSMKVM